MNFLDRLSQMYGNPNAVFLGPGGQIASGTRVKVMPTGSKSETMWDGIVVKLPKKRPCARVKLNGRVWFLPLHKHQVLTQW